MERKGKRLNVLLIEPNYANKYPPIGLMKIASYHRSRGHNVVFFKGDIKQFVMERIAQSCVDSLTSRDPNPQWIIQKNRILQYIRTRKKEFLDAVDFSDSEFPSWAKQTIVDSKDYYWRKRWRENPEWDRVFVTTLFTFYWDITIETIEFAKLLVKDVRNLMVGGVLASIQPDEIYKATGIRPFVGVMDRPGILDEGDTSIIDNEPLDYSILDEVEYHYPMSNAYYGYMTRGCIRHCAFCAVATLEPAYKDYIPLRERISATAELYGEQQNLLLMDNNVLASNRFDEIIDEIIECGFGKDATFVAANPLELSIRNLRNGLNDRAYLRKSHKLIRESYLKLKGADAEWVYGVLKKYHIYSLDTTAKENLLAAYDEVNVVLNKMYRPTAKKRYVDFNQGVDARLFTTHKARKLASIAIRPLRIAFDDLNTTDSYVSAIKMSAAEGIRDFSNYLLYNFKDYPVDLYRRLLINVELCEELGVNIYSFPMKYHPICKSPADKEDFSHNRDYIGVNWNRKYIRAIQAILNSTKGKVGKGVPFFKKAFGNSEDEFLELLEMPETFILYRLFFEWVDSMPGGRGPAHWRIAWKKCRESMDSKDWNVLLEYIHGNVFNEAGNSRFESKAAQYLLSFYTSYRKDIITPGTTLYKLKLQYDLNPTIKLRRKKEEQL